MLTETPSPQRPKLGLIAGEGHLPVEVAYGATQQGFDVVAFTLHHNNVGALKQHCQATYPIRPGLMQQNLALWAKHGCQTLVFAGKVNKWILFTNLQMDATCLTWMKEAALKTDDGLMHTLIARFEEHGHTILPQTQFLTHLFEPKGVLTFRHPTQREWDDMAFGYHLAKTMGALDVGQTVVVADTMPIAIEAIEGTDACLKRAGQLTRKRGGVVVKVAKPNQDNRFDVPTVGVRTLATLKASGLTVLAVEAEQTLLLDKPAMLHYANRHGLCVVSYQAGAMGLPPVSRPNERTPLGC
jgi:DUF1009 family protein